MTSRLLRIEGRVQGVGYRNAMETMAARIGLSGWVRNRLDGSVEAHIEGDDEQVACMIRWAHSGPAGAAVSQVLVAEVTPCHQSGFVRRPTA
ncbi:acylphosphatase [Chitinimonas sp. BJYL2]|uniref:acylphosphatase n=1 Tax=Chitinimonas sp. BJYL2 TaxID=2976696 RepID=UPI0022B3AB5B|nr:acylphosphatase [Chitinimonas sp. BJYL2]